MPNLNPDPNAQGIRSPSIQFLPRQGGPVVTFSEWTAFLRELTVAFNSVVDYANSEIWKNPNMPTVQEKASLVKLPYLINQLGSILNNGAVGGSGVDNHVTRWDGVSNVQSSNLTLDDIGNLVPETDNTMNLGSSALNWQELFAKVIESSTSLTIQPESGLKLQSVGGDITVSTGTTAGNSFYVYNRNGDLEIHVGWDGNSGVYHLSKSFFGITGLGVGITTFTPPANEVYIYKLNATANKLFYIGEDANRHLLTMPVDTAGVYQAALDMGNNAVKNLSTLSVASSTIPTGGVAYFNGAVGIKVSSPAQDLDVLGNIKYANAIVLINDVASLGITGVGLSDGTNFIPLSCSGFFSRYNSTASNSGGFLNAALSAYRVVVNKSDGAHIQVNSGGVYGWGSTTGNQGSEATDTGISRSAAGILAVGTGASGSKAGSVAAFGYRASEAANGRQGVATLVGGTITVNNTSVTANSRIFLTVQSLGTVTVPTAVAITAIAASTSFVITSANVLDTSVVAYEIFEPA